jgi:hypothetical protein
MGRPIKKRFFGDKKYSTTGLLGSVGGEGVSSVTLGTGTNTPVSTLTVTVSFSAPQITGGTTATGVTVKTGNTVTSVTIVNSGTGYTTAPTVTFTGTSMTQVGSGSAVLSTGRRNAIKFSSRLVGGTTQTTGDIIKQTSDVNYLIQNPNGRGRVKLATTSTLTAGTMFIIATDANTCTYFVRKLSSRRALLVRYQTTGSGFVFANNSSVRWNLTSPIGTTSTSNTAAVTIDNQ